MTNQLLSKFIIALVISQSIVACKLTPDSGSSSGTTDAGSNTSQGSGGVQPSPSPSPSPNPVPSPTPTPSPAPSPTPSPTPAPTPAPSPSPGDSTGAPDVNCGTAVAGILDAGTISINNGGVLTNSMQVNLSLDRQFVRSMKISNTPDCSCGTWEPVAATKTWTLGKANGVNAVSVQFRDYDGSLTICASASIKHDNLPPQISLVAATGNTYLTGTNNIFNYAATDTGSGVKAVSCSLDGQAVSCAGNSGTITTSNLSSGAHKVVVTATDNLNQSASANLSFTILSPYREITQNKSVTADNKVDILVVVDNSPSMQDVQKNMAKRVSSLMDQVKNLDYRIAVTTTDPSSKTVGDGRLLPLTGFTNQYVITPAMGLANAQAALSNTVQRPEVGSASEQGIYATYRVIERALAGEVNQKALFRPDAAFSVILISDANESATGAKNKPQNLIDFVKSNWPNKRFNFNSIIVRPNDSACLSASREAYGPTYDALSRLLGFGTVGGSIIGSVCASDYGAQLSGIGQSVQQMTKTLDLECAPIGSAQSAVLVLKDGSNYTDAYEIQGLKIVFQNSLPAGKYTLNYKCQ